MHVTGDVVLVLVLLAKPVNSIHQLAGTLHCKSAQQVKCGGMFCDIWKNFMCGQVC